MNRPLLSLSIVTLLALLVAQQALAARAVLSWDRVKSENLDVAVVSIHNIEKRVLNADEDTYDGFRCDLRINNVVRRVKLSPDTREVAIPFSYSGYSSSWELASLPLEGMKALVFLHRTDGGEWEVYPIAGGIVELKEFDDPIVGLARKIVRLQDQPDPAQQLQGIIAGSLNGNDPPFQRYCIQALGAPNGSGTGINTSSVLTREMGLSHVWRVYSSEDGLAFEALGGCQRVLFNKLRGRGWELYPPRYQILAKAVRRAATDAEQSYISFNQALQSLTYFREHASENLEFILTVLDGPIIQYKFGASAQLANLYHVQRLNREIMQKLLVLLSREEANIGPGAALSIEKIANKYAAVGTIPPDLMDVFKGNVKIEITASAR
jgi:hypothetical protein